MVTDVPTTPDAGDIPVTDRVTVKVTPLLGTPPAGVTTTGPVVAPAGASTVMLVPVQELTNAVVPLKVTVPWAVPKLVPVIVTELPIGPDVGEMLLIVGDGCTVNDTPALATPPAAVTTTLPLVAPEGTVVVRLVLLQELTLAAVPLKDRPPLP